jgi:hypothetical protein
MCSAPFFQALEKRVDIGPQGAMQKQIWIYSEWLWIKKRTHNKFICV